ncbi:MAG TPA: RidA family protein [Bryobacteraceae bacterium]|jgi:enamine deaminase RidA (YjgF/YER057c/UK114 family)|nr:RidA family protein [Bryobacteraceae bacterium]
MNAKNRRTFLKKGVAASAAVAAGGAAMAQESSGKPEKKVLTAEGKPPDPNKQSLFSSTVLYGNLVFIAGVGAHVAPFEIKAHTEIVLNSIKSQLEAVGSSMDKVLKCSVFLADLKDYAGMNEVFKGRFGKEPPVRTTVAVSGVPGNSLVEIDVIAYI